MAIARSTGQWILAGVAVWFAPIVLGGGPGALVAAVVFVLAAFHFFAPNENHPKSRWNKWIGAGFVCASYWVAVEAGPTGEVDWKPYSPEALEASLADSNRPVIVDFYASWCAPCRQMDRFVFSAPEVVHRLQGFETLRVDATNQANPDANEAISRFGVRGFPTVLFLDAEGKEIPDTRLVGAVSKGRLLKRLDQIR